MEGELEVHMDRMDQRDLWIFLIVVSQRLWTRGSPLVPYVGSRGDVMGTSSSQEFVAKASIAEEGSRSAWCQAPEVIAVYIFGC